MEKTDYFCQLATLLETGTLPRMFVFNLLIRHCLLNWHLEASNDKVNWIMLDRRIYMTNIPEQDALFEEEHRMLTIKGGSSTWGVDSDVFREVGYEGFRFFRVIQVGKNSSGSDNLALSGFEIYGKITKGRWL